jgi:hypothetical protein
MSDNGGPRIMPLGQVHLVTTLTNSFFLGGQFYTYDVMTLTTVVKLLKKGTDLLLTNQIKPKMDYFFITMTCAFSQSPADWSKLHVVEVCDLVALAAMVKDPKAFWADSGPKIKLYKIKGTPLVTHSRNPAKFALAMGQWYNTVLMVL